MSVQQFNNTLVELCKLIKSVDPNSLIGNNYNAIHKCLYNSSKDEYLLEFGSKILTNKVYVDQIKKGNDKFFTEHNDESYSKESGLPINNILSFKNMWKKLNMTSKDQIKMYAKLLVSLASKHLDV